MYTARFRRFDARLEFDPANIPSSNVTVNIDRSEFGMTYGIPEPGSRMGVGDRVELVIEAEFTGPPQAKPQAS